MSIIKNYSTAKPVEILLVEDNPGDVRLTQEAFSAANFETTLHTATTGSEALQFLRDSFDDDSGPTLDFILLDLNLPQMDGFEVLEEIRDHEELALIPVLILTSSKAEADIIKSYERSVNAYLTKPSDHDEFVALAQAVEEFWVDTAQLPPSP